MAQPGFSFSDVIDSAPIDLVHSWVGSATARLLSAIDPSGGEDGLRRAARNAIDVESLIAEQDSRSSLLKLLPQDKQRELLGRLGLSDDGDPQEALLGLRWAARELRGLHGFLGLVDDRAPDVAVGPRRVAVPGYGLFDHQRQAARRVRAMLYEGERRAILHLPTGGGKTRTAINLVAEHLRENEPSVVVWLARGHELLEQAAQEFEKAWASVGNRPVDVVRYWGDASVDLDDLSDGAVVLGLDKAAAEVKTDARFLDRLAVKTTLTVFDEAHQAIAPSYRRVVDALTLRRDASCLGLTATPGRTWSDIDADARLAEFFARQKVSLEIDGYANPVTALVDEGYLARPQFRTVADTSGMELSPADRRALARSFDLADDLIAKLADDTQWNLLVVRTVLELAERHSRILVFGASVAHCRMIATAVSAMGVHCDFVTGQTGMRRRAQAVVRFKSPDRRPMVLCNFGVLTTGFDAPAASAAVIARPTRSLVLYSQMVGRVIRGTKAGGTDSCEIVTVVNPDLPGFGDVAEAFTNWEDVWEPASPRDFGSSPRS